jgi:hypothetical protein
MPNYLVNYTVKQHYNQENYEVVVVANSQADILNQLQQLHPQPLELVPHPFPVQIAILSITPQ